MEILFFFLFLAGVLAYGACMLALGYFWTGFGIVVALFAFLVWFGVGSRE